MQDPKKALPNFKLTKPKQEPCLDVLGGFITAFELHKQKILTDIEMKQRKIDAGKFMIEAKMHLWYVNEDASYWKLMRKDEEWHFRDE